MTDTDEQPPRILVVTPHPDDAESGAGGTIARFASQGSSIALVVCTNGDKGTSNGEVTPAQLVEIREGEQLKAAEVLGIERVSFLHFPDQGLEDNDDFREKVVREIRIHKPDIVFTMDPNHLYINHRDHRMCGRVTLDAIFPYARDHLAYPQHLAEGLEPHKVREVYLWRSEQSDLFLDITETYDKKFEALYCHGSQVGDRPGDGDDRRRGWWKERHEEAGRKVGVKLAESFKRIEIFR